MVHHSTVVVRGTKPDLFLTTTVTPYLKVAKGSKRNKIDAIPSLSWCYFVLMLIRLLMPVKRFKVQQRS